MGNRSTHNTPKQHTDTARAFARSLETQLFGNCFSEQCAALRDHVLFGTIPVKDLHPWLTATLRNWTSTRTTLHATKPGTRVHTTTHVVTTTHGPRSPQTDGR